MQNLRAACPEAVKGMSRAWWALWVLEHRELHRVEEKPCVGAPLGCAAAGLPAQSQDVSGPLSVWWGSGSKGNGSVISLW